MLSGATDSIRIEPPGLEKAEFVVTRGSVRELHQAKRSIPSGSWTIARLSSDGLLSAIGSALNGNRDVFVFVSGSGAQALLELSDAARDAASPEEFSCSFLRAATRRIPFERLLESWNCDSETAIEYLNRIEVRTIGERDLDELIQSKVALLFRANPHRVTEALLNIIEDSVHRTVTREEITRQLAEGGYPLREIPEAELAHLAVRRVTGQYLEGERSRLIRGELVPRKAVETLLSRIQENTNGVLTGKAGAGKRPARFTWSKFFNNVRHRFWRSGSIVTYRPETRPISEGVSASKSHLFRSWLQRRNVRVDPEYWSSTNWMR